MTTNGYAVFKESPPEAHPKGITMKLPRFIAKAAAPFWVALMFLQIGCAEKLENGDLLFQSTHSRQSRAIEAATHSPFSHVGMLVYVKDKPYVFEAVGPVKLTPLQEWIEQGRDERFAAKRLKSALSEGEIQKLIGAGKKYLGLPYDLYFEWSDKKIYCSELVWKVYRDALALEISPLKNLGDYDLEAPVVKDLLRERYGDLIPHSEPVVAPSDLYESKLLKSVIAW